PFQEANLRCSRLRNIMRLRDSASALRQTRRQRGRIATHAGLMPQPSDDGSGGRLVGCRQGGCRQGKLSARPGLGKGPALRSKLEPLLEGQIKMPENSSQITIADRLAAIEF